MKYLKGMPRAALAAALVLGVGLAGTIGTANAGTLTWLTIWNDLTPSSNIDSANQQALPETNGLNLTGTLIMDAAAAGPINFNLPGPQSDLKTIGDFLASGFLTTTPPCKFVGCLTTIVSKGLVDPFSQTSLMRFTFTVDATSTVSVEHDDGVSLFHKGVIATASDLLAVGDSHPASVDTTETITLAPGDYDLWYVEANGTPAVLKETETLVPVPEPATMFLGGLGLIAFGYAARRRLFGR